MHFYGFVPIRMRANYDLYIVQQRISSVNLKLKLWIKLEFEINIVHTLGGSSTYYST